MLRSAIRAAAADARFESVNDRTRLQAQLAGADLLVINRALDGDFGVPDGVALIRELGAGSAPPMMLVSNYPEAQQAAQAAGAVPGFGKASLHAPETRRLIADALSRTLLR
jgi:hypothetical protein